VTVPTPERTAVGHRWLHHPARLIIVAFAAAIAAGTALLLLPVATVEPGGATLGAAAFTATSAVTITGHVVIDTSSHWSGFGHAVILGLVQLGGFGIMTLASIVLVSFSRRLGLRHRLVAQAETGVLTLGEVGRVVRQILLLTALVEVVGAVVLAARFATAHDEPILRAAWLGLFHAVSAFNNSGFALFDDNLMGFVTDPVVNGVVIVSVVLGGLGVPVLVELLRDRWSWRRWSLHTKLVLTTTAALLVSSWAFVGWFEWTNDATLGPLSVPGKALASLFHAVSIRTAGFNTVDISAMNEVTWLLSSAYMFIGAAPVSTGGGIRVTTFALLGFAILAELRGDRDITMFGRRVPVAAERQALAIALIGVGVVVVGTLAIMAMGDWGLGAVLVEVTGAFGTAGLSTGITQELPTAGRWVLCLLMFAGRVGPLTLGAALADRSRDHRFRLPEERPLLG
jgi:trk system potassium uptake protein